MDKIDSPGVMLAGTCGGIQFLESGMGVQSTEPAAGTDAADTDARGVSTAARAQTPEADELFVPTSLDDLLSDSASAPSAASVVHPATTDPSAVLDLLSMAPAASQAGDEAVERDDASAVLDLLAMAPAPPQESGTSTLIDLSDAEPQEASADTRCSVLSQAVAADEPGPAAAVPDAPVPDAPVLDAPQDVVTSHDALAENTQDKTPLLGISAGAQSAQETMTTAPAFSQHPSSYPSTQEEVSAEDLLGLCEPAQAAVSGEQVYAAPAEVLPVAPLLAADTVEPSSAQETAQDEMHQPVQQSSAEHGPAEDHSVNMGPAPEATHPAAAEIVRQATPTEPIQAAKPDAAIIGNANALTADQVRKASLANVY